MSLLYNVSKTLIPNNRFSCLRECDCFDLRNKSGKYAVDSNPHLFRIFDFDPAVMLVVEQGILILQR